jgi:TRAP-type mannitol/chloroaromatic compound transport system permease large subunit
MPQWWYSIWLPLVSALITLRALGLFIRQGKPGAFDRPVGHSKEIHDRHLLFVAFLGLMFVGVPIGAALGLAGAAAIALANADTQWFGLLAVPQNFYAGLGKYPLLAIPMFVLVGSIFDRSGVALRLVNFAVAIVGRGPGMLPLVAIAVAMFLGGISGSGPANAAPWAA